MSQGSLAYAVRRIPDDQIRVRGENSHAVYIEIGRGVTVSWMPGYQLSYCHTCHTNSCPHITRVDLWRETHPTEAAA